MIRTLLHFRFNLWNKLRVYLQLAYSIVFLLAEFVDFGLERLSFFDVSFAFDSFDFD